MRRATDSAFTLIELMLVVGITGVLASVAIPVLVKYINKARDTEGLHNVQKIAASARAYFEATGAVPNSGCGGTFCHGFAETPHPNQLVRCEDDDPVMGPAEAAQFKQLLVWRQMLFQPEGNFRFEYSYDGDINRANPASLYVLATSWRYTKCSSSDHRWIWFRVHLRYSGGVVHKDGPERRIGGY